MMAVSKVGLLRSSSEDSFEHIDPDFDNSYYPSELFGVAIADYIPLEKDEILIRKGDKLIIAEQSLDQKDFIVVNTRTQSQGKVPTNFVKIVADETSMEDTGEIVHVTKSDLQRPTFLGRLDSNKGSSLNHGHPSLQNKGVSLDDGDDDSVSSLDHGIRRRPMNLEDEETESDLDQSVSGRLIPGKKAGKMGIVRRKGVSKNKGSPYRSSGSSHEDEGSPVRVAGGSGRGQHKVLEQRRNDLHRLSTPPADSNHTPSSMLVSSTRAHTAPRRVDMTRSRTVDDLDGFVPYPAAGHTKEERGVQAIATLPDMLPEYKHIEKYNIVSVSGADRDGRPVVVFSACRLPPVYQINHQRLFEYLLLTLDQYVEQDYTVLYFHYGFTSANKLNYSWLKHIYSELDRKYKKNLKKFYIVHPTNFVRMVMILCKPFISYKFGRKITYINRLEELRPVMFLEQVDIPDKVKEYDARLMSQIRNVAHTESRSMFHVSSSSSLPSSSPPIPDDTRQFGVHLSKLKGRSSEDPFIPLVVQRAVEYLEKEGLTVMGIFRRAPNNVKVKAIKRRFDQGEDVDLFEWGDPHIAAVLIKMFLRELPEPLLTFDAYSKVVKIGGQKDEGRLKVCCDVIHNLPQTNYDLLDYLMTFVDKVRALEDQNKMNSLNLAIVFGPNLIWSTDEVASLVGLGEINGFVHFMINHRVEIFTKTRN